MKRGTLRWGAELKKFEFKQDYNVLSNSSLYVVLLTVRFERRCFV